ncbi:hypothetical protein [Trichococcus shcherbakoviae]|uniref:hypothetical protein n=1 Tax=Trichococcus shcherbakoviae TaxID=2094020 RepID=UPI002AA719CC|nr:hypothetical protein [Trichococcus shcherbakoviae]
MEYLKSKKWWTEQLIINGILSVVMGIIGPLVKGFPITIKELLIFGVIGTATGIFCGAFLPLGKIGDTFNKLFTQRDIFALKLFAIDVVLIFIITAIIQIFSGFVTKEAWILYARAFPIIFIIAYPITFVTFNFARKVCANIN